MESPDCGTCEDCIDNDGDGSIDFEDPACASFTSEQRFAVISTGLKGAYPLYIGNNVNIESVEGSCNNPLGPLPGETSRAGACGGDMSLRPGASLGILATEFVLGGQRGTFFGHGLHDERDISIRSEFVSNGGPESIQAVAPFVGPGYCSNDMLQGCTDNADCGGLFCAGRQRLGDSSNPFVNRTGTAESYQRCQAALARAVPDSMAAAALPCNVPGYTDGSRKQFLRTTRKHPLLTITLGSGLQVMCVNRVALSQKSELQFIGQPDTTLVIRLGGALRFGSYAKVTLGGGLTPHHVLWNVEGERRGVRLARSSQIVGTVLAPQRRFIRMGNEVHVYGALVAKRIRLLLNGIVTHYPFIGLLP